MNRFLTRLIVFCSFGLAAGAGAAELTLFENDNFNGRRFATSASVPNLDVTGFNDRASSVRIRSGSWQICGDAFYRGRCVTLEPGDYPSLNAMGLNDRVSSVREFSGRPETGGAPVVLYDADGFGGGAYPVTGDIPNLDGTGFNDRVRSIVITQGRWEFCVDANYGGGCQVYGPGRYANLGALGGQISSVHSAAAAVGGGGAGGLGGGSRVILYEGPGLSGRSYVIAADSMSNLDGTGFNDRAASLRVERGYWQFCSDAQFQGTCRTFGPGDYPSLPPGLGNAISSGRRISEDDPYKQQPNRGR